MNTSRDTVQVRSRSHRLGATLLEVLVMIVILSFVLTAVAAAMATLWREQHGIQDSLTRQSVLALCSAQLRSDAHLSNDAELVSPPNRNAAVLRLIQREIRIEYAIDQNVIRRTQFQNDNATHREVYKLGENIELTWKLVDEPVRLVNLSIKHRDPFLNGTRQDNESSGGKLSEQIEATIGLIAKEAR